MLSLTCQVHWERPQNNIYVNYKRLKTINKRLNDNRLETKVLDIENLNISNQELKKNIIGVASKDDSEVIIKNSEISDIDYGLAIYQKKLEFGPSSIATENLNFLNVENEYLVEKNSDLSLEGVLILSQEENVYNQLYGEGIWKT